MKVKWKIAPNNSLAHDLESGVVIEGSKPDKQVLLERILANLSKRVKRGRYAASGGRAMRPAIGASTRFCYFIPHR